MCLNVDFLLTFLIKGSFGFRFTLGSRQAHCGRIVTICLQILAELAIAHQFAPIPKMLLVCTYLPVLLNHTVCGQGLNKEESDERAQYGQTCEL